MSEVTVRQANCEDAGDVAQLSGQLGYPASHEEMRRRISRMLDSQQDGVFVAVSPDGKVIGWTHVFAAARLESEPFAEIGGIVVAASHQRHGVGKALLVRAEQWAAQKGLQKLRVRSRTSRDEAHRLFTNLGFQQTKTQCVFDKPLS